ncbi:transcription factor Zn, C2H2 [Metarhizium guizhouense ARSEF 977]|uniref:Transcription factor Zn, C2H2 n=1 Tax=Metarhizium guizhouense (strain ARSEF 977) TaxID=1276136 RepID=A0A0B4GYL3_METGA|nr:transcription factor Zn, C2H2 [Metarhizium guizhouense ARSEF 977]
METHQDTLENTITIRSVTQECRLRLQECVIRHAGGGGKGESINAPNLARSHWAENRLSDFNLWDAGVGASAAAPNSLDLRLRKDASAKKVVISSLSTLATWATLYRDVADGLEPQARGAGEEDDQTITLEEARLSIEQQLGILVNLGVAIRQSGAISRLGNADGTFQKHKHKYSSLIQHLTFILQLPNLARAKVPVGDGGAAAEMIQVPIASDEQRRPLRFEQQVLIDANARRRHRFEFARERRGELKIAVDPQDSAPASSMHVTRFTTRLAFAGGSVSVGAGSNWRDSISYHDGQGKHVSEDLEPYTCYLPGCPQDNRFFNTFKAWKTHVFSDHQVCRGWTCHFCQEPRNFAQESAFSAHVRAFHRDAVSEEYLGDLSTTCQIIDEPTLDMCPVCSMHDAAWTMKSAEYTQFEPGTDSFLDHIGKCMHDFALRALPSPELDGSVEESSAAPTGAAYLDSRSSLASVSLGSSTLGKDDRGLKESDLLHVSMYSSHENLQAWLKGQQDRI